MDHVTNPGPRKPADVGVLFVHGIGEQKRSDTLVRVGEALKGWLERWLTRDGEGDAGVAVRVSQADLSHSVPEQSPAHAELSITASGSTTTWLLAESWWAGSFSAPRYADLWRWSFEVVPLAVADHFVRRFRLATTWYRQLVEMALLAVAIILLPLLTLTTISSLVVGILPIPRLRSAILGAQKILLGTVGDSYALLESSIRGAAMVSRVQHDLRWLQQRAGKTVVVAHSQGAAVAHAALQSPETVKPEVFFTFGAGLRKLLVLDKIRGGSRFKLWLLSGGLLMVSFGLWSIYRAFVDPAVRMNLLTIQGIDPANVPLVMGLAVNLTDLFGINLLDWRHVTGLAALAGVVLGAAGSVAGSRDSWSDRVLTGVLFGLLFGIGGLLFSAFMNVGPWSMMALLFVAFGVSAFISGLSSLKIGDTDTAIDARLDLGAQIRWIDRYAWADPVPNGPLVSTPLPFVDTRPVTNLGSPLRDHSAYWRNQDQFLPAVTRAIADLTNLELRRGEWDDERLRWAAARRTWRVKWLVLSRVLAAFVALSLLVRFRQTLWRRADDLPGVMAALFGEVIDVAQRIPFLRLIVGDVTRSVLLQALWLLSVLACVWVIYKLFESVWSWWDRAETNALFARTDYHARSMPFVSLVAVLSGAVAVSLGLTAFLDRWVVELWVQEPSIRILRDHSWWSSIGYREASSRGLVAAFGIAFTVGYVGVFAAALGDWWTWGHASTREPRFVKRSIGYALLAFAIAMPAAATMVGGTVVTSADAALLVLATGLIVSAVIAALWAIATTRAGRRLRQWLHDQSMTGPFGRWLARGDRGAPVVARERLCARAAELSAEWTKLERRPLHLESLLSEEAAALAGALAPPTNPDEEQAMLRLTGAFPYAALAAAERLGETDPALARRILTPNAKAPARAVRRRIRALEKGLGAPKIAPMPLA